MRRKGSLFRMEGLGMRRIQIGTRGSRLALAQAEPNTNTSAICMEKDSKPQNPSLLAHATSISIGPSFVANIPAT